MWSIIYILKNSIFSGITLKEIMYDLILGKAVAPLYYIIVLIQLTIMTPWLVKNRKKYMYLLTPVYLIILYWFNVKNGHTPMCYETLFPAWFSFYLLGLDCKDKKFVSRLKEKINFGWVLVALLISISEAFILLNIGCSDGFATSQIRIGSYLYASAIILILMKYKEKESVVKLNNIFAGIGNLSYGIFYVHILVLFIVDHVLRMIQVNKIWMLYFGLSFLLTAIGSIMLVKIVRIIANKLNIEKILIIFGF